jgi:hypothetical protein
VIVEDDGPSAVGGWLGFTVSGCSYRSIHLLLQVTRRRLAGAAMSVMGPRFSAQVPI